MWDSTVWADSEGQIYRNSVNALIFLCNHRNHFLRYFLTKYTIVTITTTAVAI